jgi:hypothetical protein
MEQSDRRYYRYVGTTTLSRLLRPLDDNQILLMEGQRNWRDESVKLDPPTSYITFKSSADLHLKIKYNSMVDGKIKKEALLKFLKDSGAKNVSLDRLDVLVPTELSTGQKYAEINEEYAGHENDDFVARFEKYNASRDGVENDYTKYLSDQRGDIESDVGIRRASMDFQYALPLRYWREVSNPLGRLSKQYKSLLKKWESFHRDDVTKHIRTIVKTLFPDMTNGREYTLKAEGRWVLSNHGDF